MSQRRLLLGQLDMSNALTLIQELELTEGAREIILNDTNKEEYVIYVYTPSSANPACVMGVNQVGQFPVVATNAARYTYIHIRKFGDQYFIMAQISAADGGQTTPFAIASPCDGTSIRLKIVNIGDQYIFPVGTTVKLYG